MEDTFNEPVEVVELSDAELDEVTGGWSQCGCGCHSSPSLSIAAALAVAVAIAV